MRRVLAASCINSFGHLKRQKIYRWSFLMSLTLHRVKSRPGNSLQPSRWVKSFWLLTMHSLNYRILAFSLKLAFMSHAWLECPKSLRSCRYLRRWKDVTKCASYNLRTFRNKTQNMLISLCKSIMKPIKDARNNLNFLLWTLQLRIDLFTTLACN